VLPLLLELLLLEVLELLELLEWLEPLELLLLLSWCPPPPLPELLLLPLLLDPLELLLPPPPPLPPPPCRPCACVVDKDATTTNDNSEAVSTNAPILFFRSRGFMAGLLGERGEKAFGRIICLNGPAPYSFLAHYSDLAEPLASRGALEVHILVVSIHVGRCKMSPEKSMSDSIPAHFDGERILLDEPVQLEPNAKLIIQVLPQTDPEREVWLDLSKRRFAETFANGEDEYSLDLIKETNPD
jgi:hypothetical protein